jgi:hypothetical protein
MAQSQQVNNTAEASDVDIDYLAINRARWDERAPHVCYTDALLRTVSLAGFTHIYIHTNTAPGRPFLTTLTIKSIDR